MSITTQSKSKLELDYMYQLEEDYWNQMIIRVLDNFEYFKQMETQLSFFDDLESVQFDHELFEELLKKIEEITTLY